MINMSQTTITSKGEVVIPEDFRKAYHLLEDEVVQIVPTKEGIMLKHGMANMKVLRGLMKEEIDMKAASNFIKELRKGWRL